MAKVRLRRMKQNPVILGGKYELTTHFSEVPFRYARRCIGDAGIVVEWTEKDRREMKNLPDKKQNKFARALKLPEGELLERGIFRSKDRSAAKKAAKKAAKAQKEPEPEIEKDEPLPPDLKILTNKELRKLLEKKGLSTEGKKAVLVERLTGEA